MVIKDLLNKVAKPPQGNSDQVKQLREKLSKLQQSKANAAPQQTPPGQAPQAVPAATKTAPAPQKTSDSEIVALAKASAEEQRKFAQREDPKLRLEEEKTRKLITKQMGEVITLAEEMNKRITKLEQEKKAAEQAVEKIEKKNEDMLQKMHIIDQRLEKFMGLYEVITNKYNPFANAEQLKQVIPGLAKEPAPAEQAFSSEEKPAVKLADNLTGNEDEVPLEQGSMSSENAKKLSQLLAELEEQERNKQNPDEIDEDEEADVEVKEQELQKQATEEIHEMLAAFEARIKAHIDQQMEDKLHGTITNLEAVLNNEIKQAVSEQVTELKENEDIIQSALDELTALETDAPEEHKEQLHTEVEQVQQEVRSVDEQIKAIPPSLYFRLKDGRILKSMKDLQLALQTMPEQVFNHHVSASHNHFADWLELALNNPVGKELRGMTRQQMAQKLSEQV